MRLWHHLPWTGIFATQVGELSQEIGENTGPPPAVEGFCSKIPSKCHPSRSTWKRDHLMWQRIFCSLLCHITSGAGQATNKKSLIHVKQKERILCILKQKYGIIIVYLPTNLPWKSIYKCRAWPFLPWIRHGIVLSHHIPCKRRPPTKSPSFMWFVLWFVLWKCRIADCFVLNTTTLWKEYLSWHPPTTPIKTTPTRNMGLWAGLIHHWLPCIRPAFETPFFQMGVGIGEPPKDQPQGLGQKMRNI